MLAIWKLTSGMSGNQGARLALWERALFLLGGALLLADLMPAQIAGLALSLALLAYKHVQFGTLQRSRTT